MTKGASLAAPVTRASATPLWAVAAIAAVAMHGLYWHLPTSPVTGMLATPPPHIRRMVG